MAELRRAPLGELRNTLLRVKKHLAPANTSGSEGVRGQGSEVPSDDTPALLSTAQFPGAGTPAERVAMDSVDRIKLIRAPRMRYKFLLPNGAHNKGRTLGNFRRLAK